MSNSESTGTSPAPVEAAPAAPAPGASSSTASDAVPAPTKAAADVLIAEGKKAIALKQWEEGVAKYADALGIMTQIVGDQDPSMAPLLLSYGKALFELAVSQSGVMGKEEAPKEAEDDDEHGPSNLIESADPEIMAEAEAAASAAAGEDVPAEEPSAPEGQEAGDEEPEDDYNAAWEVLDVARGIYLRIIEDASGQGKGKGKEGESAGGAREEVKKAQMMLADCYQTLGDISCETENFEQAVSDYTSALSLLTPLHPPSSRILASLHFTLGAALEFLPSRRADALSHVQSALSAFLARQEDLGRPTDQMSNPDLAKLSEKDREAEKKEVGELIGDLEVKVEELKSAPEGEGLVEEGIRHLVGSGGEGAFGESSGAGKKDEGPVNDLSGMVRKKKKPAAAPVPAVGMHGAAVVAAKVEEVVGGVKEAAGTVKEAVVDAGEKAAAVVQQAAEVVETGAKRAIEGDDAERDSKRAKAE